MAIAPATLRDVVPFANASLKLLSAIFQIVSVDNGHFKGDHGQKAPPFLLIIAFYPARGSDGCAVVVFSRGKK